MISPKHTFESVVRELREGLQNGTVVLDRSEEPKETISERSLQTYHRRSPLQSRLKSLTPRRGASIFISYSHKDAAFLDRLWVHIRHLESVQSIEVWDDRKIEVGQQWRSEIDLALKRAKAAVLLVSANFLASDFIADEEVPRILEEAESEGTLIIPVILTASCFTRDPRLNKFQAVNDPSKPLAELPAIEQEKIYDRVRQIIESDTAIDGDLTPQ